MSVVSFATKPAQRVFCSAENDRYAAALADRVPTVACDGFDSARALSATACLRRSGTPFFCAPLLADARAVSARRIAAHILAQINDPDQLRLAFEALRSGQLVADGQPLSEAAIYSPAELKTLRDFTQMGDAAVFRSQTERMRVEGLLGVRRERTALVPISDAFVPQVWSERNSRRIVIWAPDLAADALAIYVYALWYLQEGALIVCRGALANTPHTFVAPESAVEALRAAAVIVDANLHDPGTALAFADRGFGLVVAATSGADEYIDGVASYDPADFSSILSAVSQARADRRTRTARLPADGQFLGDILAATQPVIALETPLVSVIVPTYNRPSYVDKTLRSLAEQSYANIEAVIVNDGGTDISAIVEKYPFARLVSLQQNIGAVKAVNIGFRAARGIFIANIADDDLLYPNHFSHLINALQLSGARVAHSNCLMHCILKNPDGSLHTFGYAIHHDTHLDQLESQWAIRHTTHTMVFYRSVYEELGYWNEDIESVADHELIMRLARAHPFVHVNFVTGEAQVRSDGSTRSDRDGDKMVRELAELHSIHLLDERPIVAARRRDTLAAMAENRTKHAFFHVALPLPEPEPWNEYE